MPIIAYIIIGITAGFIAVKLLKGGGFGFFINSLLGVTGSFLGGWLFSRSDLAIPLLWGSLASAILSAAVLLWVGSLFNRIEDEDFQ